MGLTTKCWVSWHMTIIITVTLRSDQRIWEVQRHIDETGLIILLEKKRIACFEPRVNTMVLKTAQNEDALWIRGRSLGKQLGNYYWVNVLLYIKSFTYLSKSRCKPMRQLTPALLKATTWTRCWIPPTSCSPAAEPDLWPGWWRGILRSVSLWGTSKVMHQAIFYCVWSKPGGMKKHLFHRVPHFALPGG